MFYYCNQVIRFLLPFLFVAVVTACNNKRSIEETIIEMSRIPIVLPIGDMISSQNDRETNSFFSSNYKLVVYADSSECSSCFIKHLSVWNDYLRLEDEGNMDLVFIIEVPKEKLDYYSRELTYSRFNHLVYFDVQKAFRKNNPQIPKEGLYHIFLIDENNQIVMVGNPIANPRIEKMLFETVQASNNMIIKD